MISSVGLIIGFISTLLINVITSSPVPSAPGGYNQGPRGYQRVAPYIDNVYRTPLSGGLHYHPAGGPYVPSGVGAFLPGVPDPDSESKYYYGGKYKGACQGDGLYYKDDTTFVMCSNGYPHEQACPPGTKTSGSPSYKPGYYYGYTDLCSVNLVDYGLSPEHYAPVGYSPEEGDAPYGHGRKVIHKESVAYQAPSGQYNKRVHQTHVEKDVHSAGRYQHGPPSHGQVNSYAGGPHAHQSTFAEKHHHSVQTPHEQVSHTEKNVYSAGKQSQGHHSHVVEHTGTQRDRYSGAVNTVSHRHQVDVSREPTGYNLHSSYQPGFHPASTHYEKDVVVNKNVHHNNPGSSENYQQSSSLHKSVDVPYDRYAYPELGRNPHDNRGLPNNYNAGIYV